MSPSRATLPLLLALSLASACDKADSGARESAPASPEAPAAAVTDAPAGWAEAEEDGAIADATEEPAAPRMVIRTARIELRSDDPGEVIRHAIAITERGGGFVATSDSRGVGDDVDLVHATLRVPSTGFEGLLSALRSEGELLSETLGGDDVTEQYVDLSARLRSQRALEERLLDILSKVASVEDALSVEAQLTRVRTDIERLDGQRRSLENHVSFATIDLTVSSPVRHNAVEAETVSSRLDRALDDAGSAFVAVLGGLIRMLGVLLPLGLVFAPIGYAVRGAWRRRRSRSIARVYGPGAGPPAPPIPPSAHEHR